MWEWVGEGAGGKGGVMIKDCKNIYVKMTISCIMKNINKEKPTKHHKKVVNHIH